MATSKAELGKATAAKLSAVEDEATDPVDEAPATVTLDVEVKGTKVSLVVPATFEDADPDVLVAMENERFSTAFKELIGDAQWRQMKALGWSARDFRAVVNKWQEISGLGNA